MPLPPIAALNTQASPPQIDIGSGLSGLMEQFKAARLQSVRRDVMPALMSGDPKIAQSGIMRLMAIDPESGYKAAAAYKSLHPDLDPYKALSAQIQLMGAQTAGRNADTAQKREQAYEQNLNDPRRLMSEERRTFCAQYPQLCPELNQAPAGGGASTADDVPVNVAPVADSVSYTNIPANTPPTTDPRGAYIPAPAALPPQPQTPAPSANPSVPKNYDQYKIWQKAPVEQAEGHYNQVADVLDRASQQAKVLLDDPKLWQVVGLGGTGGEFAGSHAADIRAAIDTLTNQIGLAQMQDIRDQTKSGASPFQRTTNFEFGALMHSIASLKTTQSPDQFRQHLQYILTALDHAKTRAKVSFQESYNRAPNLIEYDTTEVPKGGTTGGGGTTSGGLKWSVSP